MASQHSSSYLPTTKACLQCSLVFSPKHREGQKRWSTRRFCTRECFYQWNHGERHGGHAPVYERLDRYTQIDAVTGCWNWTASRAHTGYGTLRVTPHGTSGTSLYTHIISYVRHRGSVPDGLVLDHLCRNKSCLNPEHLEPVSFAENIRRGSLSPLCREDVDVIRSLRASGVSNTVIAKQFFIHPETVSRIVNGRSWTAQDHVFHRRDYTAILAECIL